jgi:PAS domain S-box-containing protein
MDPPGTYNRLPECREQYRRLLDNLPIAVFTLGPSPEYALNSANRVFLTMLGYSGEDEIHGIPARDLFAVPADWGPFNRALTSGSVSGESEVRLRQKGGTDVWASLTLNPVRSPDNRITGADGYARDITESRIYDMEMQYHDAELTRFALALAQANRKLGLLGSITRHDIINQLTALMMAIELMKEDCHDENIMEYIRMEGEIARKIEQQILFTRDYFEIGGSTPLWYEVRCGIESAAGILPIPPGMLAIEISSAVCIYADPLIEKVFYNLMENALRHGKGLTRITFSSSIRNGSLVVVCEDNGPGVPAPYKENIFTRQHYEHTGLGLFLSREILGITGLSIRETGVPGNGARFEITVPAGSYQSGHGGT